MSKKTDLGVVITVLDKRFKNLEEPIRTAAKKLLTQTLNGKGSLEIYLVGKKFMNKNVLAYPAPKDFPRPDVPGRFLGEIYLNPEYIKKYDEDIFFMLTHGFLHLLGYNHKKRNDRIKMVKEEAWLLLKITNS